MSAVHETIYIAGNARDPLGNPVPFVRTTGKMKHIRRDRKTGKLTLYGRYIEYKDHVRASVEPSVMMTLEERVWPDLKSKLVKYFVDVRIVFKGKAHADSDNIVKGIVDALFGKRTGSDDKLVIARVVDVIDCQTEGHVQLVVHGPYPRSEWADIPNQA